LFAIELRRPKNDKTEATVLMPSGLKLDTDAVLKVKEKNSGKGLQFSICLPQGCLLPVRFLTVATYAMRNGTNLVVASCSLPSSEPVTLNISLNNFSAALTRLTELAT